MKDIKFTHHQILQLSGPGVYIFKRGKSVLYVGASAYGLGRALGPNHVFRRFPKQPTSLTFIPCGTANAAFELEVALINEHQPCYNSKPGGQGEYVPSPEALEQRRRLAEIKARGELPSIQDLWG